MRRHLAIPFRALFLIAALFVAASARADTEIPKDLDIEGPYRVIGVIDGDTAVIETGREVRFVGIQAPKLPLGRAGFEAWPLAEEAKAAVQALLRGRRVFLGFGGRREDRHGRLLAHLFIEESGHPWVQARLLSEGLARVYGFADNRALLDEMLVVERGARQAGRGIWSEPFYQPVEARELEERPEDFLGRFEIVEGRILRVALVRGRTYLNFGADWRRDFTATLDEAARRLFEKEGLDVGVLEGRRVRLRGWLNSLNGPMVKITHPEQIEVLEE
jgi:endonuclease YncB( thermonuclease family)